MRKSDAPYAPVKIPLILCTSALIFSIQPVQAHDSQSEFDRFENAVQCAGLWYGDYAALAVTAPDEYALSDAGETLAYAKSFRKYALETSEGSAGEVDYLISVWQQYFFRLAIDGGGSWQYPPSDGGDIKQWASVQFDRHARYCQGFGLTLGPAWGFH